MTFSASRINVKATIFLLSSVLLTTQTLHAEGIGASANISTLGYGADVTVRLTDQINFRTSYRVADDAQDFEEGDFDYSVKMDAHTTLFAIDWHPMVSGFRLSAGIFAGGVEFEGQSRCRQASCDLGSGNYDRLIVGDVTLFADTGDANPYIGIGYGNAADAEGLGFTADIGVMINTNPEVQLTSSRENSSCPPSSPCDNDLKREAKKLEDEFEIYPILGIGISYTF